MIKIGNFFRGSLLLFVLLSSSDGVEITVGVNDDTISQDLTKENSESLTSPTSVWKPISPTPAIIPPTPAVVDPSAPPPSGNMGDKITLPPGGNRAPGGLQTDLVDPQDLAAPFDLNTVTWLYPNVSGWAQTATLNLSVSGSEIILDYDKKDVWPYVPEPTGTGKEFNANAWVFIEQGGTWYGASFTWLRKEKFNRPKTDVSGANIKRAPLDTFNPVSGQTYYFMVSGLARMGLRNVSERSNIVKLVWP